MPEFTQEQIDAIVAEKISEAKKGLFTEEDLNKKVVSEVDRRVESGIQKGLETQKQKWEKEFSERAKLSAEDIAKKDFDEKLQTITVKEKEVQKKVNQIEAKSMLTDASIPKSYYDKFIPMLISDDEEVTKANVQSFIDMYVTTKTEIETKIKKELSIIPKPTTGGGDEKTTKDDFKKMGYADKMKFKMTYPELYKEYIK